MLQILLFFALKKIKITCNIIIMMRRIWIKLALNCIWILYLWNIKLITPLWNFTIFSFYNQLENWSWALIAICFHYFNKYIKRVKFISALKFKWTAFCSLYQHKHLGRNEYMWELINSRQVHSSLKPGKMSLPPCGLHFMMNLGSLEM